MQIAEESIPMLFYTFSFLCIKIGFLVNFRFIIVRVISSSDAARQLFDAFRQKI
jgi:hypothetical protein